MPRLLSALALAGAIAPAAGAEASAQATVTRTVIQAPASVARGGDVTLHARLTAAGVPLAGRTVQFAARPLGGHVWHALAQVTTGSGGWATAESADVRRPMEYAAYYRGYAGLASSPRAVVAVHVVDIRAAAPARVVLGHRVRLSGRLLLDGEGVGDHRLHFLFRRTAGSTWHDARWARADHRGWARISDRFRHSFQVGVRFEGADGLARSPLAVEKVRVVRPAPPPAPEFVFPFRDPSTVDPQSMWTQDDGVDIGAGGRCGRAATLVAIGDGVVVQEGIDGFGPTAPVLRMTSGVFAGRYVYYGHTGHNFAHVGDRVRAGERLTTIGCGIVGYSRAPHLEIGVGVRGGPTCCPGWHVTSAEMWRQLVASDPR